VVETASAASARPAAGVVHELATSARDGAATRAAAAVLNTYDVFLVQHEYGIYGGADGEDLLPLLALLRVPVMTVLHTVPAAPTPAQHRILQAVVAASDTVVTMTYTARDRLFAGYQVDRDAVQVIPHGVAESLVSPPRRTGFLPGDHHRHHHAAGLPPAAHGRPIILTWGLLGQGKGIEWGIEAMAALTDLVPRPMYVVAGQTHPRVVEHEGERYRDMLTAHARSLGVADDVLLDGRYLADTRLHRLIRTADVVLLPYDSREQVTSGVLVEAVSAGRAVVSTRFPHAVELLGDGTGVLVEQSDPTAILTGPRLAGQMRARARRVAPSLTWRTVAGSYVTAARGHADRELIDLTAPAAHAVTAPALTMPDPDDYARTLAVTS